MLELYENIKKFRKEKKMSQEQLAKLTGYTDRSSIAKIEKGEVDIPQSKIMLFAKALDIDPGTLMGNDGAYDSADKSINIDSEITFFSSTFQKLSPSHQENVLQYIEFLSNQEHHDDEK